MTASRAVIRVAEHLRVPVTQSSCVLLVQSRASTQQRRVAMLSAQLHSLLLSMTSTVLVVMVVVHGHACRLTLTE